MRKMLSPQKGEAVPVRRSANALAAEMSKRGCNAFLGECGREDEREIAFPPTPNVVLRPGSDGHILLSLDSVESGKWPCGSHVPSPRSKGVGIRLIPVAPVG